MNSHQRVQRGEVGGWSEGATRRNTQFLYSVSEDQLSGSAYAVTLTLRDCPPTGDAWHRLRRAWEARMRRAGMLRLHWVTEWQRRGVPHLHGVVFFPEGVAARGLIVAAWLAVAAEYGAGDRGQFVNDVTGIVGWFQYLSKHAVRGVKHYQRSGENMPAGWKQRTGRMWGKVGDWPVRDGIRITLEDQHGDKGWFAYRRLVRSWRVADARRALDAARTEQEARGARWRVRSARGMLRCSEKPLSRVRGVSEWISQDAHLSLISNLASRGYRVQS